MSDLTNPATGHTLRDLDDASVDFWKAAGYREAGQKKATKKAPTKKAASSKKSSK